MDVANFVLSLLSRAIFPTVAPKLLRSITSILKVINPNFLSVGVGNWSRIVEDSVQSLAFLINFYLGSIELDGKKLVRG